MFEILFIALLKVDTMRGSLLVLLFLTFAMMATYLFFPRRDSRGKKGKGADGATDIEVKRGPGGIHIVIHNTYDAQVQEEDDSDLLDSMIPPGNSLDRDFWEKVASYQTLPDEERTQVVERMIQVGLLREKDRDVWRMPAPKFGVGGIMDTEAGGEEYPADPAPSVEAPDMGQFGLDSAFENINFQG